MNDGIIYFLAGEPMAAQLIVSLSTLRTYWSGPVAIIAVGDRARRVALHLSERDHSVMMIECSADASQSLWTMKPTIPSLSPFTRAVYLDADTLICGDIAELFPVGREWVFVRHCDWTTGDRRVRRELSRWSTSFPSLVHNAISARIPRTVAGIFGFFEHGEPWRSCWDSIARLDPQMRNDDPAMLLCYHQCERYRVLDDRFNAHPKYHSLSKPDVRVWHGSTSSFFRYPVGRALWFSALRDCLIDDIYGLETLIGNAYRPHKNAGFRAAASFT